MPQVFEPRVIDGGPRFRFGLDRGPSVLTRRWSLKVQTKESPRLLLVPRRMLGPALAPRVFLDYH
jgi:hypothetical protein